MGRKNDKGSNPARASGTRGSPPVASPPQAPDALDRELRELHDRYGADAEIPEQLVELARRVAEAYGRRDQEDADVTAEEGCPA